MRHFASPSFWDSYQRLPARIRDLADRSFAVLKRDPQHPSLHFKRIGRYRSVRIGIRYRALAVEDGNDLVWFWIGTHSEYDRLLKA